MAEQPQAPAHHGAGAVKWVIILAIAGLGVYLYMKHRSAGSASPTATDAAAEGATSPASTPVYTTSMSGTYNGAYTPSSIYNSTTSPLQSAYSGNGTVSDGQVSQTTSEGPGGISVTNTATNGS